MDLDAPRFCWMSRWGAGAGSCCSGREMRVWLVGVAQAGVSGQQGVVWETPSPPQKRYRRPKATPGYLGTLSRGDVIRQLIVIPAGSSDREKTVL